MRNLKQIRHPLNLRLTFFLLMFYGKKFRESHHCVKSVRIRNYSGPHFPAFGPNMESRISPYSVRMREKTNQNNSEYGHFLRGEYLSNS